MVGTDGLLVLLVAEIIRLLRQMHQKMHAQIADQRLRLSVDTRLSRQLLHYELLNGSYSKYRPY